MIVTKPVYFPVGSLEYLTVTVTADVPLDNQPVSVSIDGAETWLPCVWQGDAGTTRKARTTSPITFEPIDGRRSMTVTVKVTDSPEVPLIRAGVVQLI